MTIDLSADVGEGAEDLPIFPFVTSVSVACGAHAGDAETMARCIAEAARLGVAVGAHPGYPDREGSGRADMTMSDADLTETLVEQIGILADLCGAAGVRLTHVKPHGALYNRAAVDPPLAGIVAGAVAALRRDLILVGLAGSAMIEAARRAGLPAAEEAFADRRYVSDGTLAPRTAAGALIEEADAAADQAVRIATGRPVGTLDGPPLRVAAETICLHADTPGAAENARAVREALERAGVRVAPLALR